MCQTKVCVKYVQNGKICQTDICNNTCQTEMWTLFFISVKQASLHQQSLFGHPPPSAYWNPNSMIGNIYGGGGGGNAAIAPTSSSSSTSSAATAAKESSTSSPASITTTAVSASHFHSSGGSSNNNNVGKLADFTTRDISNASAMQNQVRFPHIKFNLIML